MALDAGECRNDEIARILSSLIATTQEVMTVLKTDDFDPNSLDRLQGIRSKLYVYLQQSIDTHTESASTPLAGHPLVAELLELEKQAYLLAKEQHESTSEHIKALKQQRQVTKAYASQPSSSGRLLDMKEF